MHIRRGALNWGVFLILAGAVPLAVRAGYLTDEQVSRLWSLWPLILVGIGVGLILSRTHFDFLGGLVIAATFGLMVGGLLSGGLVGFPTSACGPDTGDIAFASRDGSFSGNSGSVELQLDCGKMTVAVASGTAWRLEGKDTDGKGPDLSATASSLRVKSNRNDTVLGPFTRGEAWNVTLPDGPRLDLSVHLNAGSSTADLGTATLGEMDLQLNAGSSVLNMGSARALGSLDASLNAGSLKLTLPNLSFNGSIEANAGSVEICAPAGAALRLHTDGSNLSSFNYGGQGLIQDGSTWSTPGYATATVKIDLRTKANVGSFSLNPEGGCD